MAIGDEEGTTTIQYLFSARDMASGIVSAAEKAIDVASRGIEKTLGVTVKTVQTSTAVMGGAFKHVFGDALATPVKLGKRALQSMSDLLDNMGEGIETHFLKPFVSAFKSMKKLLTEQQFSFENLFDVMKAGAGKAFELLKTGAQSAAVQVGGLLQQILSIEGLKKGAGAGMGLLGMFFGPVAPILKLLSPLINVVTGALQPAMESFGAIVRNAFAPFSFLADMIVQSLAPTIQKFLRPLTSTLLLVAVNAGKFLQSLQGVTVEGSGLGKLFQSVAGVAGKFFGVISNFVQKIIPILSKSLEMILPVVSELVDMIGDFYADYLDDISDVITDVLPDLVETVVELTKALTPLLAGILKIGTALLKYVFAPALKATAHAILKGIKQAAPYIREFSEAFLVGAKDVVASIVDFYGNFSSYMDKTYVLFIKPAIEWWEGISDWLGDGLGDIASFFVDLYDLVGTWFGKIGSYISSAWDSMTSALSFDKVGTAVSGAFDAMLEAVKVPINIIRKVINDYIIDSLNKLLTYDIPVVGKLGELVGIKSIPRLAQGAVVNPSMGGTPAVVGEGGRPEIIMPRTAEAVEKFVAPVISKLEMPSMREMIGLLSAINQALRGTLKVTSTEGGRNGSNGSIRGEEDDLGSVPGVASGAIGGW